LERLRALGPGVLPALAAIYTKSTEDERAVIAQTFYNLGWKSPDAKAVLLRDIDTQNPTLRLQVQWALGRVSDDKDVVDRLATIMQNDPNPLFRDKAACALAYDQIHLSEKQKVKLYGKLIEGLSDSKRQVRMIAIKALEIHTGQTKGFDPNGTDEDRRNSITRWKLWLDTYEKNL
ncbi:MAG: HEAT repeat domain-containing protein, partial [Thermoanaerobaculia bacterium]